MKIVDCSYGNKKEVSISKKKLPPLKFCRYVTEMYATALNNVSFTTVYNSNGAKLDVKNYKKFLNFEFRNFTPQLRQCTSIQM